MNYKNYNKWFNKKYADKDGNFSAAAQSARYLTRTGWLACKKEVLKILEQDWTGLDMSINSCDKYYIDRIKKEL